MEREDKPSLLLSFHTEVKQESLDADCDSGAQCSLVDSEMMSVKLEDKSQPLGLNDIKYEEEEKIGDFINQETTSVKQEDFSQTLGLNVIIKDEEEEEEIGDSTNHAHLTPPVFQSHLTPPVFQSHLTPPVFQSHLTPHLLQSHQTPPFLQSHQTPPLLQTQNTLTLLHLLHQNLPLLKSQYQSLLLPQSPLINHQ
ncbi:uncharacterized protein LOC105027458 isoform X3 [Esox lucius]|uniref:uncharacterized protein LOC105027458 isoform X3 n=1 Tax=Esox lucius TaxID=8010 RepID=UPI0014773461|nr:uncharacterized protein LOC105027458 isoform X3 [Esox lucius]